MFNIIPFILILGGIAAAAFVLVRRFPQLAALDVATIPQEREVAVKKKILQTRIERKFHASITKVTGGLRGVFSGARERMSAVKERLHQSKQLMEKSRAAEQEAHEQPEMGEGESRIRVLLTQATELVHQGRHAEAEKRYIEIISIDPKHAEAYRGLGELYVDQNEFGQAKETFAYITKLNPTDHQAYFELAEVARRVDDLPAAIANVERALELEPEHVKYLDFLIEACILQAQKEKAVEALERLKWINPENQKIPEWEQRIAELE